MYGSTPTASAGPTTKGAAPVSPCRAGPHRDTIHEPTRGAPADPPENHPMLHRAVLTAACLAVGASAPAARAVDPVRPEQFGPLQALIKPGADEEKWLQIPWRTSLWDARQQAARTGKPILIWEMDGH